MMIIMRLTISSISFWSDNFRQIVIIFHKFKRFKMLQMFVYILEWVPSRIWWIQEWWKSLWFFSSFHIDSFRETQTCTVRSTHLTPLTKSPIAKNWHIFIYASIIIIRMVRICIVFIQMASHYVLLGFGHFKNITYVICI